MLAQHAACVATGRTRFRTEAWGQRRVALGERLGIDDFICNQIGQRNFGGWNQPATIRRAEQIFRKFRQLAGAIDSFIAHHQRRHRFGIAMFHGVQVEHELAKRTFEACKRPLQHGKARTCELCSAFKIHVTERLAQLEMFFRLKGKVSLVADATNFDIVAFVLAKWHVFERNIGNGRQSVVQFLGQATLFVLSLRKKILQLGDFGLQLVSRCCVLRSHGLADFLRSGIAALLRSLNLADIFAAFFVQRHQFGRQRLSPTLGKRLVEGFRVFANPFDVEHGKSRFVKLNRSEAAQPATSQYYRDKSGR